MQKIDEQRASIPPRTGGRAAWPWRRISDRVTAFLLVVALLGYGFLSLPAPDDEERAIEFHALDAPMGAGGAAVLSSVLASGEAVTLEAGDSELHGIIHAENMAPGQRVVGALRLHGDGSFHPLAHMLSLHIDTQVAPADAASPLHEHLLVESILWNGIELLPAGATQSLAQLDDPIVLHPLPSADTGTPFAITVRFDPQVGGDGTQFAGQTVHTRFVFTVTHRPDADLTTPTVTVSGTQGPVAEGSSARVRFDFSKPMHKGSVEAAIEGATGWKRTWDDEGKRLVLRADALSVGRHSIGLAGTAHDIYGIPLGAASRHLIEVTPPLAPPGPVRELGVVAGDSGALLRWLAPLEGVGTPGFGYRVYVGSDPARLQLLASPTQTSHAMTGLLNGETYAFWVSAFNAAGEGPLSGPVQATPAATPSTTLTLSPPTPNGDAGWYVGVVTARLSVEPEGAEIRWRLDGGSPQPYGGPISIGGGAHTLTFWAQGAGGEETPRTHQVKVDESGVRIAAASLSGADAEPGAMLQVRVEVQSRDAPLTSVRARIADGDEVALHHSGGGHYEGALQAPLEEGDHAVVVVALNEAGSRDERTAGTAVVASTPTTPAADAVASPESQDEEELEPTTLIPPTGGPQAPDSSADLHLLDENLTQMPGIPSVKGKVHINLETNVDVGDVKIVIVWPDGREEVLSEGQTGVVWDTASFPDGYYRIETRQTRPDGGEFVIASRTVLVNNDPTTLIRAGSAALVGVGILAGASAVGSPAADAVTEPLRRIFRFAGHASARRRSEEAQTRQTLRRTLLWMGAALALVTVAFAIPSAMVDGWRHGLASLAVVGLAGAAFFAVSWGGELFLLRAAGVATRFRILTPGVLALFVSGLLLRHCFGLAGHLEQCERPADTGPMRRREAGLRALAVLGIMVATVLVFVGAGTWWRYDLMDAGLSLALMVTAASAAPVNPMLGHAVWRWNRTAALLSWLLALALYLGYVMGFLALTDIGVVGALGASGFVAVSAWTWKRRKGATGSPGGTVDSH